MKNNSFDSIHTLLKTGDFDGVIRCLTHPGSQRLKDEYRWDANHAWYCVGLAEFDLKKFQNAANAFGRALKSNPKDSQSLLALGDCYDEMKRPKLAENAFRKALAMNVEGRHKAALQVNLGNALYDQKRFLEATEYFLILAKRRDFIGRIARINLKKIEEISPASD